MLFTIQESRAFPWSSQFPNSPDQTLQSFSTTSQIWSARRGLTVLQAGSRVRAVQRDMHTSAVPISPESIEADGRDVQTQDGVRIGTDGGQRNCWTPSVCC